MRQPRLLDLFCGAGGAAAGYQRAGFEVVGVDIEHQPHYPLMEVQQNDAMLVLADPEYLREFDVVHASPPCQMYSRAMKHLAFDQPMLIEPVRAALRASGVPYVIEHVVGAPLIEPVTLCGTGLGLRIYRHRLFESNTPLVGTTCDHTVPAMNPHNQAGRDAMYAEFGRRDPEPRWRHEMGVSWMSRYEAREAIPPAYTEYLGRQIAAHLMSRAA
jgi:DNA (cytosine-5)-methyltransferase 1